MFDIGWSEMAVIAFLALIVLGPKELPNAMRTAAKWAKKARSLAREFQSGVDDMIREADLEDARKALKQAKSLDIDKLADETIDPSGSVKAELKELDETAKETASSVESDKTTSSGEKAEDSERAAAKAGTAEVPSDDLETPVKPEAEKNAAPAEASQEPEKAILPPGKLEQEALQNRSSSQDRAKA